MKIKDLETNSILNVSSLVIAKQLLEEPRYVEVKEVKEIVRPISFSSNSYKKQDKKHNVVETEE